MSKQGVCEGACAKSSSIAQGSSHDKDNRDTKDLSNLTIQKSYEDWLFKVRTTLQRGICEVRLALSVT